VIRVAAMDCGTNSLRLLVADVDAGTGVLRDVERRMEIVRLGEGVDRTGRIAPGAMARTLAATERYAKVCADLGVQRIRYVATSATRDADNRAEFVAGVQGLLGVPPEVVSGDEEARLSFDGATRGLPGGHPAPYLVVDIGGGSTEFVLGESGTVLAARSVDIGCVRLTERYSGPDRDRTGVADAPAGSGAVAPELAGAEAAVLADVDAALARAAESVDLSRAATLIGLAGSVTTITAHALGLPRYDSAAIHGSVLPVAEAVAACTDLAAMGREERLALPYLHPGRADVIAAGALVWRAVIERVAGEAGISTVVTSEHDILDGIAWSLG
jgi:exopolyphosphatase / guanosine-5'-triphosphate,3'-diphosphate pyrophosphatase